MVSEDEMRSPIEACWELLLSPSVAQRKERIRTIMFEDNK